MSSSRITLIISAVALAVTVAVVPLAIRGGVRYYGLNKVLRLPQAPTRLAVKPTTRRLTNGPPVHLINLGYASFDSGSTNELFVESVSSGASVIVTNRNITMAFLPPFAPRGAANLRSSRISEREARAKPNTLAWFKEWETNELAAEMASEETQSLPISRILLMNGDDFLLYALKVASKAGNSIGSQEVEFFQSTFTKGIVRFGETGNDSPFAAVYFASLDGSKNVGLLYWLANPSSTNLSACLMPILGSFRFTAESVGDRNVVEALIRGAGIQKRKDTPVDK